MSSERLMGVIGTGTMGAGIAQAAATAGFIVEMIDTDSAGVDETLAGVKQNLDDLVASGKMPGNERDTILPRLGKADSYACFKNAECVIEAVREDMDTKRSIFAKLVSCVSPRTLLVTTTGILSIEKIAEGLDRADRMLGMRFYNPVPERQVVELVRGPKTSEQTLIDARSICTKLSKTAVKVVDSPGFIGNRVSRPFFLEALRLLETGEAGVRFIDDAIKDIGGFEMGPFETLDFIGLDIDQSITDAVYVDFGKPTRFTPSEAERKLVAAGHLGRKTGRGFYDYADMTPAFEVPLKDRAHWKPTAALTEFAKVLGKPADRSMWVYARILLGVVNEGAWVADSIALPRDVNLTMELGFLYPEGPLMAADSIGLDIVQRLLKDFWEESGHDERYKANPLLDKHVAEGNLGEMSARGFLYHALF